MSWKQSSPSPVQDQSGTGSQRVLSRSFTDVEYFKQFYCYRQFEIIQLTPGSLKSDFLSVKIGNLYFIRSRANQRIQSWGAKQKDYLTFSIVWVAEGDNFYSHKLPVSSQTSLFAFDRQRDVDLVTDPGMMTDIFIPVETFQTYANQLQRHDLDDRFLATNHVSLLPNQMREIKTYLMNLFWLVEQKVSWLEHPHVPALIADDLVPLLISNIPINRRYKVSPKPSRRAKLIAQAEQKMFAHLEKPLTLKELAQQLESSSSALSYGFQDLFGMSPMRYLKVQRLNAVRRCLKASDPEGRSVETLANQFGFFSPGHFARDYKAMFGEFPSETLRGK